MTQLTNADMLYLLNLVAKHITYLESLDSPNEAHLQHSYDIYKSLVETMPATLRQSYPKKAADKK